MFITLSNVVSFALAMKNVSSWPTTKPEGFLWKSSATFSLPVKQLYPVKSASRRHMTVKKHVVQTHWDQSIAPTSLILIRMFRQKKSVKECVSQQRVANTTLTFLKKTLRTLKTVSFSLICLIHKTSVWIVCQAQLFVQIPQHQSTHLQCLLLLQHQAQHPPLWPLFQRFGL